MMTNVTTQNYLELCYKYIDLFKRLDRLNHGYLSENEVVDYFKSQNFLQLILQTVQDINNNRYLNMEQFVAAMFIFDSNKGHCEFYDHARDLDNYDDVVLSPDFSNLLRHCEEASSKQVDYLKMSKNNTFSSTFVNLVKCLKPTINKIQESASKIKPSNNCDDESSYVTALEYSSAIDMSKNDNEDYPYKELMPGTYVADSYITDDGQNLMCLSKTANKIPYGDNVSTQQNVKMSDKKRVFDKSYSTQSDDTNNSICSSKVIKGNYGAKTYGDINTTKYNDDYCRDPGTQVPTIIPNSNKRDRHHLSEINRNDETPIDIKANKTIHYNSRTTDPTITNNNNEIMNNENLNPKNTVGAPSSSYNRMKVISKEIDELKKTIDTNIHLFHTNHFSLPNNNDHRCDNLTEYADGKFGKVNNPVDYSTHVKNNISPADTYYMIYPKDMKDSDCIVSDNKDQLNTIHQNVVKVIPNSNNFNLLGGIDQLEQLEHDIEGQLDDMTAYVHNYKMDMECNNFKHSCDNISKLSRTSSLNQVDSDEDKFLNYQLDSNAAKALQNYYDKRVTPRKTKSPIKSNPPVLEVCKGFENFLGFGVICVSKTNS